MGDAAPASPITSAGPGRGGSVGSGQGDGIGRGAGAGVGPGTGGGTGGGRFGPGSGVTPPTVIREVRPAYTEEARRRAIEGAVELELVVMADGRVGSVHVVRGLGAGLDERAALAARDWRFNPATRRGTPIDVVVNVRMQFSLR